MKITVYFHNGCKAQFDIDKVKFVDMAGAGFETNMRRAAGNNISVVNWNNVSFIQPVKEEKDEL